jgi:hypothetical protein
MKVLGPLIPSKIADHATQTYWSSRNRIEVWGSTSEVPRLVTESTSQDWIDRGKMSVAHSPPKKVIILTLKF